MLQLIFGKHFEGNKRIRFIDHQTKKNRPLNQKENQKKINIKSKEELQTEIEIKC